MTNDTLEKSNSAPITKTVQTLPGVEMGAYDGVGDSFGSSLTIQLAQANNNFIPFGTAVHARDRQLAAFWKTEPFLASTINSIVMARASLTWELTGPPKSVAAVRKVLRRSDFGHGWQSFIAKIALELLTADNGAFIEVVRAKPRPGRKPETGVVLGLNHLPSAMCYRTGNPNTPVIYVDANGVNHKLKWYQVATLSEIPIPNSENKNIQLSFVSRVLKMAETMRSVAIYQNEKITGQFGKAIHVVSGVSQNDIENIQKKGKLNAQAQGNIAYMSPLILSTLDPSSTVSKVTLELASLPDKFNYNEMLVWYITLLALASGSDYMDLAPLPGKGLGTAAQSDSLAQKSRVKGILLFMKLIENALETTRVLPPNVGFKYSNTDAQAEKETATIKNQRAKTREIQIKTGEITPEIARQIAVDDGDLKQEYLMMMGEGNRGTVTIRDDERVSESLLQQKPEEQLNPISIDVADKASKWIKRLIKESPVQSSSPIPESQLNTFTDHLRALLKTEMSVGTDGAWQDYILTKAANLSGIHAHALRYRLPDNYRIHVNKNKIVDSENNVIYVKPVVKDTSIPPSEFINKVTLENYVEVAEAMLKEFDGGDLPSQHMLDVYRVGFFSETLVKMKLRQLYYEKCL